jgi:glycosyltransferase involved in cell wall biosynthesis
VTLPVASILTPSYNQAQWLVDNLRSVAAQTYRNVEHVVMDGGSTDGSAEILQATPGVVWDSGRDDGQSDALNRAFSRSTGEIIGWLNSDDAYFSRNVVARAVDVFQKHPEVGVVYGHGALVNGSGRLLHVLWTPPFSKKLLRSWYNPICQPTVFVRRSAIGRTFFVDRDFDYMMDRELWLYLSGRTLFHRLDQILAIDRHHPDRKSYTSLDVAAHDYELISQRYGVPGPAASRFWLKIVKLGVRFAGLSKVIEAARGGDAIPIDRTSPVVVALRQVGQFRRQMPVGDT